MLQAHFGYGSGLSNQSSSSQLKAGPPQLNQFKAELTSINQFKAELTSINQFKAELTSINQGRSYRGLQGLDIQSSDAVDRGPHG
jgi:hypothetical protein